MKKLRSRSRSLEDESGFTLPEVLVMMLMMLTVMFALYGIFDMGIRVFSFGNDKVEAAENARIGLERMEREIRAAYPQSGGTLLLSTWTSSQIAFQNKPDSNPPVNISYGLSVGSTPTLLRNGQEVVEFVDGSGGLTFTYFGSNGNLCGASNPTCSGGNESQVAAVGIDLRIKVPGIQDGTQSLTTRVDLRNR